MSDTTSDTTALREMIRSRGTEMATKNKDDALDKAVVGVATLSQLMDDGKLPPSFLVGIGDWIASVATAVESGQPVPPITGGAAPTGDPVKPEHRRLIQAVERRELELDPSTGLPKAADSSAETFNAVSKIGTVIGVGKLGADTPDQYATRVRTEVEKLKTGLGDIAEGLGLKKDANPDEIVKAAKAKPATDTTATDKLGEVAEALGLKKDAKPDEIVAAAKVKNGKSDTRRGLSFGGR